MGGLRPIGSEKLSGMDKIRRIMEIATYDGNKGSNLNEYKENDIQVLLLNSMIEGAGMNLENTTHLLFMHKTEEKFNSQIFRDKEKNLFCRNYKPNPIKLVRIPYTSKTKEDITRDIDSALDDPSTFILTGNYPKAGWNK
jgi:hypothetical protein